MAKAWKCDRCGSFFEHGGITIPARVIGTFQSENVDLCDECGNQFRILLDDWWKYPNIPFNYQNYKGKDV